MLKRVISIVCSITICLVSTLSAFADETSKTIRVGVIPTVSSVEINKIWKPVLKYFENRLGIKCRLYTASDYAGIIEAMRFKKIEIAYFGPKSYIEAHRRANAWAIIREQKLDGSTGYHSIIITKKGSDLNSLKDLKGKMFAFNDPNSTSGYLVPMTYFLKEAKIVPEEYFSKVVFSGSHEASIMAVKTEKVDAASTNDLDLARVIASGKASRDDFNIIWKSKIIPGSPIAVRGDLPYGFVMKLKKVFLEIPVNLLEGLQLKGYVETKDSDYDCIREMKKIKEKLKCE